MTVPNVTICWCTKTAKCQWCEEQIEVSEPMVRVFFWNKGADGRRWNGQIFFHPQHWLDNGMDYLQRNPYIPHVRKTSKLSPEDRAKRHKMVLKFNSLHQRKQNIRADYPDKLLVEERLDKQMHDLFLDMINMGGRIPGKWLEKIAQ